MSGENGSNVRSTSGPKGPKRRPTIEKKGVDRNKFMEKASRRRSLMKGMGRRGDVLISINLDKVDSSKGDSGPILD